MTSAALLASLLLSQPLSESATFVRHLPRYTFELRFVPYRPRISDKEVNQKLFKQTFKEDLNDALIKRRPMMFALELDRYYFTEFGLLGIGGRIGYWKVDGHTRVCANAAGNPESCTADDIANRLSEAGNTKQSLTVVPLSASVVYRFDYAYREHDIPLVPYGKAGLDWHYWNVRVNGDIAQTANGNSAQGATWGWHASAGLALNIDWLEPGRRRARGEGVQGSFIFGEVSYIQADNFGQRRALDMSDVVVLLGLSIDIN